MEKAETYNRAAQRQVLVCFSGKTEIRWLRILKPGFRHCLALVDCREGWLLYDPLSSHTALDFVPPHPAPLLRRRLEELGYRVVETRCADAPRRQAPFFPCSCVESVKRVLGIHARRIVTPWQLYRFLRSRDGGAAQSPS